MDWFARSYAAPGEARASPSKRRGCKFFDKEEDFIELIDAMLKENDDHVLSTINAMLKKLVIDESHLRCPCNLEFFFVTDDCTAFDFNVTCANGCKVSRFIFQL